MLITSQFYSVRLCSVDLNTSLWEHTRMIDNQAMFSNKMLQWHEEYGRKNLPWQGQNPYYVWISEIMLQQTQVKKVILYFNNFMKQFPTLEKLSQADIQQVLSCWSGLGYYNRAKNLHNSAKICAKEHANELPIQFEQLLSLPGIGKTTAGAILSLSLNLPYAILDGNVKRVISRVFTVSHEKPAVLNKKLWEIVDQLLPKDQAKDYNQSLMDLGSMVCKRSKPLCSACPLAEICKAYQLDQINRYPQAKTKTRQLNKTLHALMIRNQGEIFLQQRPANGIWPQLWFLPTFENRQELLQECEKLDTTEVDKLSIEHILTHRIFDIQVTCVNSSNNTMAGKWQKIEDIKLLPHPTALIKIIEHSS